jgi:hypothetical protein
MNKLTQEQEDAVVRVMERARKNGSWHVEFLADHSEASAYRRGDGRIAWCVASFRADLCIVKGTCP